MIQLPIFGGAQMIPYMRMAVIAHYGARTSGHYLEKNDASQLILQSALPAHAASTACVLFLKRRPTGPAAESELVKLLQLLN